MQFYLMVGKLELILFLLLKIEGLNFSGGFTLNFLTRDKNTKF
jgi:hypothetical protein